MPKTKTKSNKDRSLEGWDPMPLSYLAERPALQPFLDNLRIEYSKVKGDGDPIPAVVFLGPNGAAVAPINPTFLQTGETKDTLARLLCVMATVRKATIVIFFIPIYQLLVSVPRGESMQKARNKAWKGNLQDCPDAIEMLMVWYITALGTQLVRSLITRAPGRAPELGPWQIQSADMLRSDPRFGIIEKALQRVPSN